MIRRTQPVQLPGSMLYRSGNYKGPVKLSKVRRKQDGDVVLSFTTGGHQRRSRFNIYLDGSSFNSILRAMFAVNRPKTLKALHSIADEALAALQET